MAGKQKEPPALQDFISLRSAAALAYTGATGQFTSSVDILNKVAGFIAAATPVFVRSAHNEPVRVLPLELSEGELEGGGEDLRFKDGRATLGGLVILQKNLGDAIDQVRLAFRPSAADGSGQR